MKKMVGLIRARILKVAFMSSVFVVTMTTVFAAEPQPTFLTSFNLKKLTSLKFVPNYTPGFCGDLNLNPAELKIGINPGFLFYIAKNVCKPVLYVTARYKVDKWLFNTIKSEYQRQFFCGIDKKIDDLATLVLERTDIAAMTDAINYVNMFASARRQNENSEYESKLVVVNKFLNEIETLFNVRAFTFRNIGVFALNILVKTCLFRFFFDMPDLFDMNMKISNTIEPDPFGLVVIMKEVEVMAASLRNEVGQMIVPDFGRLFSSDDIPSSGDVIRLEQELAELQSKIKAAAESPERTVPADLAFDYAINYDLPAYVDNLLNRADLKMPAIMKNYWYWFAKELFVFWSINSCLATKLNYWIMNDFNTFISNLREIKNAKESGNYSKIRAAREHFKSLLRKTCEEQFGYKNFLKGMFASSLIDFVVWSGYFEIRKIATSKNLK